MSTRLLPLPHLQWAIVPSLKALDLSQGSLVTSKDNGLENTSHRPKPSQFGGYEAEIVSSSLTFAQDPAETIL